MLPCYFTLNLSKSVHNMWFASNTYEPQAFKVVTYCLQLGYELGIDTFRTQWIFVATTFVIVLEKTCFFSVNLTNFAIFWKRNCLNHKKKIKLGGQKKGIPYWNTRLWTLILKVVMWIFGHQIGNGWHNGDSGGIHDGNMGAKDKRQKGFNWNRS